MNPLLTALIQAGLVDATDAKRIERQLDSFNALPSFAADNEADRAAPNIVLLGKLSRRFAVNMLLADYTYVILSEFRLGMAYAYRVVRSILGLSVVCIIGFGTSE